MRCSCGHEWINHGGTENHVKNIITLRLFTLSASPTISEGNPKLDNIPNGLIVLRLLVFVVVSVIRNLWWPDFMCYTRKALRVGICAPVWTDLIIQIICTHPLNPIKQSLILSKRFCNDDFRIYGMTLNIDKLPNPCHMYPRILFKSPNLLNEMPDDKKCMTMVLFGYSGMSPC